ncbi:hypothetical protein [Streptomyces sp. ISID311]|uniref:hypothetical protein n=1 Tax=Streptomyces sp. ISID311 TaxID=2601673 RepID=UPI0011BD3AB1|nr:hypothetical protein [Streptomyces sp. ISID311]TXC93882.1 hypothetical protein FS847_30445 [Streptomyces sp. ISID311]
MSRAGRRTIGLPYSLINFEKQQGAYGPVKEMAGNIVTSQTAETAQIRKILGIGSPSPISH